MPLPCLPLSPDLTLNLQTRLPPRLVRQNGTDHARRNEQRAARVHRRAGLEIRKHGDDGRHDAKHAVRRRRQRVAGAPVQRREDLGRVGVEDGVPVRFRVSGGGGCEGRDREGGVITKEKRDGWRT